MDTVPKEYRQEAHRKYHNQQHILECLSIFERVAKIERTLGPTKEVYKEVVQAILYHDIVYMPGASNNEEFSALRAKQDGCSEFVQEMILATKNHQLPQLPAGSYLDNYDEVVKRHAFAYFLDIDMAVMGETRSRYREYSRQIREEYAMVPDDVFKRERCKFLRKLLDQSVPGGFYHTLTFLQERGELAEANIMWELALLGG